jgi:hypothetical protein
MKKKLKSADDATKVILEYKLYKQLYTPDSWKNEVKKGSWLSNDLVDSAFESMVELPEVQTRAAGWLAMTLEKVYSWCLENNFLDKTFEELCSCQHFDDEVRWNQTIDYASRVRAFAPSISFYFYPHLANGHFRLFVVDMERKTLE